MVKYALEMAAIVLVAVYLCIMLGVSNAQKGGQVCSEVNITIKDSTDRHFVTKDDIKGYLDKEFSGYKGMKSSALNLSRAEQIIDSKSAIRKSEVYLDAYGQINIIVSQREPLVRLQNSEIGFYVDCNGFLFPLQSNYTERVTIIDGHIPIKLPKGFKGKPADPKEREWIEQIIELVQFMEDNQPWKENIVQISVGSDGDLIMIPRNGKERFVFGKPDNFERKFERMDAYYTAVLPNRQDKDYVTVNVKYDNQIICKK